MLGVKGSSGIGPLIDQQLVQAKRGLQENVNKQQQAQQQGNKIIRKVLSTNLKGVGSNLDIQA